MLDGVRYHRCAHDADADPQAELDSFGRAAADRLARESAGTPFDVVHGFGWPAAAALEQLRRESDRALIWSLSTDEDDWGRPVWLLDSPEIRPVRRYHPDEFASRILVPSAQAGEAFAAHWGDPDRIEIVHPGVDPDPIKETVDPARIKAPYGFGTFDPVVLYVGHLTPRGRPGLLLDALFQVLGRHPNSRAVFVGAGELTDYLRDRAAVLGIDEAVRFPGELPAADLARLFRACDVVCLPQWSRQLRAPYLDAWAAEKPVVIAQSHAGSVLVWHQVTGYVAKDTADGIADGLIWMLDDFDRCRWVGRNGRQAVVDAFGWPAVSAKLLDCYQRAISQRGAAAPTASLARR
jgi:glycosyltransferase involved in cell wall biosynthesis